MYIQIRHAFKSLSGFNCVFLILGYVRWYSEQINSFPTRGYDGDWLAFKTQEITIRYCNKIRVTVLHT